MDVINNQEYNEQMLTRTDLSCAVTVHRHATRNIEARLVSMTRPSWDSEWNVSDPTEVLFVMHDNQPVAFVEKLGRNNVYFYTTPAWRNRHVLSDIIRYDFLKYLWPDIISIRCFDTENDEQVRHLAKISGLQVRNTPTPSQKDIQAANARYVELMSSDYVIALRAALAFPEAFQNKYV